MRGIPPGGALESHVGLSACKAGVKKPHRFLGRFVRFGSKARSGSWFNLRPVIRCGPGRPNLEQASANFQPAIAKKRGPQAWANFPRVFGTARLAFYTVPPLTFLLTHVHQ